MKKKLMIAFILFFAFSIGSANAYTASVAIDGTMDFSFVHGFGFVVNNADVVDLNLTVFAQNQEGVLINSKGYSGAVPLNLTDEFPWDIYFTTTNSVDAFDWSFGVYPLTAGIILSVEGPSPFFLNNFFLACNDYPDGKYPLPFRVLEETFIDGAIYTYSAVPIPGAVFLFGSGLLGLLGIRRKIKN